jgi:ABC-type Zn uptake system ZnuABC Zn-binding protein ZnuA
MDPVLARSYVTAIRDALAERWPEHQDQFRSSVESYHEELEELDTWIAEQVAAIPPERRKLVTTHDAFRYFGERYGFDVVGTIWSTSTERDPTAGELRELVDRIRAQRVPAVFTETTINPRLMRRIAADAGVAIGPPLYGDSVGPSGSGADTYLGMMRANTLAVVQGLTGDVDTTEGR